METAKVFPANWKEIIRGKKVIFYNTGVTSLLRGQEKRIEKMKWVFETFKKYPEVVLWWRPHPLELSTVQSMLPDLEEQYREVRKQFEEENIGVLDESADLNRAIAISDAYYGAGSSIASLYRAVKKPVLYENNRVKRVEDTTFLPATLCIKDGFIWFIQLYSNKLVKVDRNTFEVKKMISIPFEPSYKSRVHNYHIIDVGNSLLLLLEKSKQIYEYEIETDVIKVHKPEVNNFIFHNEVVIEKNGNLLMFPYGSKDILEYDYRINTTTKKKFIQNNIKAAKCYEIIGTKVYMTDSGSNTIYKYDTVNCSYISASIGEKESRYWGVKKVGRYFVLPHLEKKAITLWDEVSGEITKLTVFPEHYKYLEEYAYLDMFEKDGNVYIFPFYGNMILKVDVENKMIAQAFTSVFFNADYNTTSENFSRETYLCAKRHKEYIYAYAFYKKCWQIFDLSTMNVKDSALFEIKEPEYKKMIEQLLEDETAEESFCEGESFLVCSLDNYIKNLKDNYTYVKFRDSDKNNIGAAIYKALLDEI